MVEADKLLQALREESAPYDRPPYMAAEEILRNQPQMATRTELLFEDTQSGTVVSHRDIGFGVSQALPVLVTALASRERLIAVEQPELHLHPALQAELGDVFIESSLGERKNTFLLETHSEHLILRVMRRIRETAQGRLPRGAISVRPSDVAVLYVERDGDHSIVREMPLNEQGELVKAWPGGFFEEGYRELFS
jgi:predicted ATPase